MLINMILNYYFDGRNEKLRKNYTDLVFYFFLLAPKIKLIRGREILAHFGTACIYCSRYLRDFKVILGFNDKFRQKPNCKTVKLYMLSLSSR